MQQVLAASEEQPEMNLKPYKYQGLIITFIKHLMVISRVTLVGFKSSWYNLESPKKGVSVEGLPRSGYPLAIV